MTDLHCDIYLAFKMRLNSGLIRENHINNKLEDVTSVKLGTTFDI